MGTGEQCDENATQYVTYAPLRGARDSETWVYCEDHAEEFVEKCATDVVGGGELA